MNDHVTQLASFLAYLGVQVAEQKLLPSWALKVGHMEDNPLSSLFDCASGLNFVENFWELEEARQMEATICEWVADLHPDVILVDIRLDIGLVKFVRAEDFLRKRDIGVGGAWICFEKPAWIYFIPWDAPQSPASFMFIPRLRQEDNIVIG
jgi:hypothetical protein